MTATGVRGVTATGAIFDTFIDVIATGVRSESHWSATRVVRDNY